MKVLIVDDSIMIWSRLCEMFSSIDGVDIVGYSGIAEDAIDKFNRLTPDVVILDIKLYGGSGFDVLQNIKRKKTDTTVVMFSNYLCPEYREKCRSLGADYFIDKSKEFDMVNDVLMEKAV